MTTTSTVSYSADQLQKIVYELLNQLSLEPSTSQNEKSIENNSKILLTHLTSIIEKRIDHLTSDLDEEKFEEEWVVLSWAILHILARLSTDVESECAQNLNHLLVGLVNRAKPVRIPKLSKEGETFWPGFHQLFNQTLHLMHDLYSQLDNPDANIEQKLISFCDRQLQPCLDSFRQMCLHHAVVMHTQLRRNQVDKMCEMSKLVEDDYKNVNKHYTNSLYILGLLAARLQGFRYECSSVQTFYYAQPETLNRMLSTVLLAYEQLLNDALLSVEPSTSSILVTNNLFTFSCSTLSRCLIFKQFDVQIVSEDTAQSIQDEINNVRCGTNSPSQPSTFPSAALLAMKPTSGVKRNNATANASGGGNTAHKKSDVNSKESVCLQPSYSEKQHAWQAQYPHLLCTTRQKDTVLLDSRSGQIGKRPLFYFYTRAKTFSPAGGYFYVRTLSLPFTIATRRNQDCQVQRMMSSYTATCFWLYGTCTVDGLLLNWNDSPLSWRRFKKLSSQYLTVNAEVKRPMEESDFDILSLKMQCDECDEFTTMATEEKTITFKNMLCPHLRFETDTTSMRFSVWRGVLEILQIFQEQKSNAKTLWDDYLLHGFLDTGEVMNLLLAHQSCMLVRLTYILGGSICVSYRNFTGELINLEPIELKKLQAKSLLEYLSDIAESAKIDYLLTARMDIMTISDMIIKYKTNTEEVKRVRGVMSNVSHHGPLDQLNNIKFTPLRVAVVACRDLAPPPPTPPPPPPPPPPRHRPPQTTDTGGGYMTLAPIGTMRNGRIGPSSQPPPPPQQQQQARPQVSFEVQLESLMKMYGKTPDDVCTVFTYPITNQDPMYNDQIDQQQQQQQQHPNHQQHQLHPYMDAPPTSYEYC